MMRMTFFWTPDLGDFFFKNLEINTYARLALLCVTVSLFAILYEGIKVFAAYSRARAAREQLAAVSCAPSESVNLLITDSMRNKSLSQRFWRLFNETTVFFFHNSIGYAVMLSVMVYSGWLFLSVILGMGLGYFLFGHITMKINMENITVRKTTPVCPPACSEAGVSGMASKSPSPCSTDSSELYQSQTNANVSPNPCYDNKITCETNTSNECHTESEIPPKKTQSSSEEDCCCRL